MTAPPYHRLARARALRRNAYAPWKPALEIASTLFFFLAIQVAFAAAFFVTGVNSGMTLQDFEDLLFGSGKDDDPTKMVFYYGSLALSSLAAVAGAWVAGRRPAALLSVAGRIRLNVLGASLAWIALPVFGCYLVDGLIHGVPSPIGRTFWLSMLVWVSLIPLQCAAEELIFRGALPQALGAWLRSPVTAFGLAIPVFVIGHSYDLAGLASVAIFAVMASVLTHRTGGIEAAIVLHCANNMALSWADIAGITDLAGDDNRLLVLVAGFLLQYSGAVALLIVLRAYAPSRSTPLPGWFPGAGWYRGWPKVAVRPRTRRAKLQPSRQRPPAPLPRCTVDPARFHRTIRPWWSALAEAGALAVLFIGIATASTLLLTGLGLWIGLPSTIIELPVGDIDSNVLMLIALAMTCAAPLLAARIVGRNPLELFSSSGRFRWRLAWVSAAAAAVAYAVMYLCGLILYGIPDVTLSAKGTAFILVCVLVVPYQALAEELLFRSAIPQIVGAWVRSPFIAYGAAVPLFAAGHGYNWIGMSDIIIYAVCAAGLTFYTNGIEAAVALHAVGNIVAFSGLGLGFADPTEFDVDASAALFSIASTLLGVAATVWALRRWVGVEPAGHPTPRRLTAPPRTPPAAP
ncbi:type II CAAX prenyl endopeptidase Rce1 family protein [Corynebacterium liangguodongii]|uniref:CAAX prenyl protease 2/Lysostaphin resistance protein A-like domain-containing protein n=1 Tax=Corynebacterium liangguodongii TaxID=2079535 RepID=A0A2S0WFJ6_9CORY|nr:CPBP family glutamic-type intramembrane protease [Corynebacterium liangguodongii]AWB84494.1 hypothetical protein C3E79_08370 [Corynebacterium liangguodongii]PWB98712.1 CPBP family intramembrane metalloprotease [Corynebacterium liangguodongii]